MGIVSERIMELIKSSGKSYRDVAAVTASLVDIQ